MADPKPSLFSSLSSGVKGYFKGAIAGGLVGILSGAAVGAVIAIAGVGFSAVGAGVVIGGLTFAGLGSIAGAATGVVKNSQAYKAAYAETAASLAFAKGVTVGHDMTVENPKLAEQESRHFREMVAKKTAELEGKKSR